MDYRSLGRTGMQVSPLCLGAMMFGAWGEPDHDTSVGIIHRALDAGIVAGAALDVTDPEPLPADAPLRSRPEVILTPHVAFYSAESMDRLQRLAVDEARRALAGEPLRCEVTP